MFTKLHSHPVIRRPRRQFITPAPIFKKSNSSNSALDPLLIRFRVLQVAAQAQQPGRGRAHPPLPIHWRSPLRAHPARSRLLWEGCNKRKLIPLAPLFGTLNIVHRWSRVPGKEDVYCHTNCQDNDIEELQSSLAENVRLFIYSRTSKLRIAK